MTEHAPDIEAAWYDGDLDAVLRLATLALEAEPAAFEAMTWLGLAHWNDGRVALAQQTLRGAFEKARERVDEDTEWQRHAVCNRLLEATAEPDQPSVARFVVDGLGFEHGASLRRLAEEAAQTNPVAALAFVRRAVAADPADAEAHYLAAKFFARLGKRTLTLKHLESAIEHGAGVLAVRTLARVDTEFDGLRSDGPFIELVDPLPPAPLRPLYAALDAGRLNEVVALAATLPAALDVAYPLREALERLIDAGPASGGLEATLAAVNADIDEREDAGEESEAYVRYCGEA